MPYASDLLKCVKTTTKKIMLKKLLIVQNLHSLLLIIECFCSKNMFAFILTSLISTGKHNSILMTSKKMSFHIFMSALKLNYCELSALSYSCMLGITYHLHNICFLIFVTKAFL